MELGDMKDDRAVTGYRLVPEGAPESDSLATVYVPHAEAQQIAALYAARYACNIVLVETTNRRPDW